MAKTSDAAAKDTGKKSDAKAAKTDMSAGITDHKSGVSGRPEQVSQKLRVEENAYEHDMMGKEGGAVAKTPEDTAKNAELSKLLHKEEERLRRIEKDLKRPDLLEKDLKGDNTLRTIVNESEFTTTGNIKTDLDMRMTDQPSPSPGKGGKPDTLPPMSQPKGGSAPLPTSGKPTGTKSSYATIDDNIKTNVEAGITDHRSHIYELSKTMQERVINEEVSYARGLKEAKTAPPGEGKPPRMEKWEGVPNVSTKTFAYITDNRSKLGQLSTATRRRIREEEQSYVRDMHPHAGMKQEENAEVWGISSPPGDRVGEGTRTAVPGSPSVKRLEATKAIGLSESEDSEDRVAEENACWFMPESVQRVIDSSLARFRTPKAPRPYRPPMLDMEVDETEYNPYFQQSEAKEAVYKPEPGRVMYPSDKSSKTAVGRRMMYETEEQYEVTYHDKVEQQVVYPDAQERQRMYESEQANLIVCDDGGSMQMMYQNGGREPMMYVEDEDDQMLYLADNDPTTMYQQQVAQQMPQQYYQRPQTGAYRLTPAQQYNSQRDYVEVSMSESDINLGWQGEYMTRGQPKCHRSDIHLRGSAKGTPMVPHMQAVGVNEPGMGLCMNTQMQFRVPSAVGDMSTTEEDMNPEMKAAAVQTRQNISISTTVQTGRPKEDTKSIDAKVQTDAVSTQRSGEPQKLTGTQTFGTFPFSTGTGMPLMFQPQMSGPMGNPFMMTQIGMQPQMTPQLQPRTPPLAPAPILNQSECEGCVQKKSCCEDVPFEDLKRNIEEDIVNIVNKNIDVNISDEDTKILVARPDSPYKLVYLIPQRPQIEKGEKSIQTGKPPEDKGIQTMRGGRRSSQKDPEDDSDGSKVIMSTIKTKESEVNGRRVRTTKSVRVTQSQDEESGTEILKESDSSERGKKRSKRRSRSKAKRANSEAGYPRSLTISLGRTNSTAERSSIKTSAIRHTLSRKRSPGTAYSQGRNDTPGMDVRMSLSRSRSQSPNPLYEKYSEQGKEVTITSSCSSGSSQTNVSIIGLQSNSETRSTGPRCYFESSTRVPLRRRSSTTLPPCSSGKSTARGTLATASSKVVTVEEGNRHQYQDHHLGRLERRSPQTPESNKMYIERIYRSRPDQRTPSPCFPRSYTPRLAENISNRTWHGETRKSVARPGSTSCIRSSVAEYDSQTPTRGGPVHETTSYIEAEDIAVRIAQQLAPQLAAFTHMDSQDQMQESVEIHHSMVKQSPAALQHNAQSEKPARLVLRAPKERAVVSSTSQTVYPTHQRQQHERQQVTSPRYAPRSKPSSFRPTSNQPPPRYILPIKVQVTGKPSAARVTASAYQGQGVVTRPGAVTVVPVATTNIASLERQKQLARSTVIVRAIEPDQGPAKVALATPCPGGNKSLYQRTRHVRLPAQTKQALTYALVGLVAMVSLVLLVNAIGKRRANFQ